MLQAPLMIIYISSASHCALVIKYGGVGRSLLCISARSTISRIFAEAFLSGMWCGMLRCQFSCYSSAQADDTAWNVFRDDTPLHW